MPGSDNCDKQIMILKMNDKTRKRLASICGYSFLVIGFTAIILYFSYDLPTTRYPFETVFILGKTLIICLVYTIISFNLIRKHVAPHAVSLFNGVLAIGLICVYACCLRGEYVAYTWYEASCTEAVYSPELDCKITKIKDYEPSRDYKVKVILDRDSTNCLSGVFTFYVWEDPGYPVASLFVTKDAEGSMSAYAAATPNFISASVSDMEFELKEPSELMAWIDTIGATQGVEVYNITARRATPGISIRKRAGGQWSEIY